MPFRLIDKPIGDTNGQLFCSESWLELLRSAFGCQTLRVHDLHQNAIYPIAVFKAGPFKVGYLGFPVGAALGSTDRCHALGTFLRSLPAAQRPHCLRIAVSSLHNQARLDLPCAPTPETTLDDLPGWTLAEVSSNVRRDLKRAQKANLQVCEARPENAAAIFELYENTIQRHRGSMRYTPAYFDHLVSLARDSTDLRVITTGTEADPAAFLVAAIHDGIGFYLHGGSDPAQRQHRPASLLMHEAITWAQRARCHSFNFMSSPGSQPSLVRYKEKWAGTTRDHLTYTLPVRPTYPLFRAAEAAYRLLRR